MNYININKKRLCGRNNQTTRPMVFDYSTIEPLSFTLIDDNNQIQTIDNNLSGLYLAGSTAQSQPSYDLLFLSKDYSISSNVITFNVDTYTVNYLNKIKKPNTDIFLELGQIDLNNKRLILRDHALACPRVYVEGLTPQEINSKAYYTKTEVDEKIAQIGGVTKEYVDAQDDILSAAIDTKAAQTDLTTHTTDTVIHVTSQEKSGWNGKQNAITADNKLDYSLVSGHPAIPTKTSDLTNDSDYQNGTQVATAITTATSGKADKSEIPTKTSDLENDSDYQNGTQVATAISGKADTSTLTAHTSDTTIHVTSSEKTNWNGKIDMPSGGTTGQILKKTSDGVEWGDDAVINPVNVSLEYKDCTTAGTFVGNFTGKQIQRYNASNATSGTITIDVVAFTSTANDICPTIECWLPANGDITTITIPSTIEVIDMPDKLEYSGETADDITYHVIVLRAAKDMNGTWCYACNYAYSFLETII